MKILCSNDDGILAPGLESLVRIAHELSDDVRVVAPREEQSGAARALTLAHPLRIHEHGTGRYSVSGTPSDAVMMAVTKICAGSRPDLLVSGVNNGQNLAEDVTVSGTIAAAFQGMSMGVPSIALSLARGSRLMPKWPTAERYAPGIIRKLLETGWPAHVVINVNFPDCDPDDVTGVEVTTQGHRDAVGLFAEERNDLRGGTYYWYGYTEGLSDASEGTDLKAVYERRISITPLHIQLTHHESRRGLSDAFRDWSPAPSSA